VIRRRRKPTNGVAKLLADTQESIGKLLKENRALRQQNARLLKELDRVNEGWEEIKKLARSAPRARRRGRG
jgi:cell division septum initiation protein DivIVA